MTKKVNCKLKTKIPKSIRVRIIKAPIVNSKELNYFTVARSKAIVL